MRTEAGGADAVIAGGRAPRWRSAATNRSNTASASSGPGAPSGWYWTVSIGRSRWRRPSTEPSLRLTWLTWKPPARGHGLGDDLDLVVLGRHLDQPGVDVADRVVRAVMAESQPAGVGPGGAGHDLVTEADPEQRPAVGDRRPRQRHRPGEPRRIARAG